MWFLTAVVRIWGLGWFRVEQLGSLSGLYKDIVRFFGTTGGHTHLCIAVRLRWLRASGISTLKVQAPAIRSDSASGEAEAL